MYPRSRSLAPTRGPSLRTLCYTTEPNCIATVACTVAGIRKRIGHPEFGGRQRELLRLPEPVYEISRLLTLHKSVSVTRHYDSRPPNGEGAEGVTPATPRCGPKAKELDLCHGLSDDTWGDFTKGVGGLGLIKA